MPASSITANDQYCTVDLRQTRGSAALFDIAGTFSGRLNFEGAVVDAPSNSDYRALNALELPDGDDAGLYSEATGTFFVSATGFTFVRVRSSAWVSGTASVNVRAGADGEIELKGSGPATETTLNSALTELEEINAKLGALGPQLSADSASVVLASDQAGSVLGDGATPISPTSYLLQTAAAAYATDTAGGGLTPVTSSLFSEAFDDSFRALNVRASIAAIGTGELTLGQKDSDHSIPVVFPSDQAISIGADLNVEKIGGEYVSSGDGSIDGKMPSMLHDADGYKITQGQKTMANSLPVVFASDQTLSLTVGGVDVDTVGGSALPLASAGITAANKALPVMAALEAYDAAGTGLAKLIGAAGSTAFDDALIRLLTSSSVEAIGGLVVSHSTGSTDGKMPVTLFTSLGDAFDFGSGTPGKIPAALFDGLGTPIPLGQALSTASIPVVLASDSPEMSGNITQFGGEDVYVGPMAENGIDITGQKAPTIHGLIYGLYNNTSDILPIGTDAYGSTFDSSYAALFTNAAITAFGGAAVNIGRQLAAASMPVVQATEDFPNVFKYIAAVAITAEASIWTPAEGKKFRLMGYHLTQSIAGNVTLKDGSGGSTIAIVPSAAGGIGVPVSYPGPTGIPSGTNDNPLRAIGAGGATLSGMVWGREF